MQPQPTDHFALAREDGSSSCPSCGHEAIETTQIGPEQCCFIDDRAPNLEPAANLGMHTIQMQTITQLREDLGKLGVKA